MSEVLQKPYHHGDLRNALIEAGTAILAEEGVAALDLRKVARRAGVSHAAPYRHFADKQALLAAIAEQGFYRLNEQIAAALASSSDLVRDQLLHVAQAYIAFAVAAPAHLREMFSGLSIDRTAFPALYTISKASFWQITGIVQRGQQRGELVAGDPTQLTLVMWSMIHGFAMLLIEQQIPDVLGNDAATEQAVRLCIQTLYEGMASNK